MSLSSKYEKAFKTGLAEDNTAIIDEAFIEMREHYPEFYVYFYQQFPKWVSLYYLQPIIDVKYQLEIIPAWQTEEPDWRERLQKGLLAGKAGVVARAMRESLRQYAVGSLAEGSL